MAAYLPPPIRPAASIRPSLGTFRFFLALSVFFSHCSPRPYLFLRWVDGLHGVVLFFIVSGFLIGAGIERNYVNRTGAFLLNRFLRIYPAYWAVLAMTVADILLHGSDDVKGAGFVRVSIHGWDFLHYVRALILIDGYSRSTTWSVMTVAWTLLVELWFYIVIAALYGALSWYRGPDAAAVRRRGVLLACYAVLGIYVACASTLDLRFENPIAYAPDFVLGVAASRAVLGRDSPAVAGPLIGASLLLAVFGFMHIQPGLPFHLPLTAPVSAFRISSHFVVALIVLLAMFGFCIGVELKPRGRRIDEFLGGLTYPLYLCHFAVIATVNEDLAALSGQLRVTLSLAIALAIAMALYIGLERPLVRPRLSVRSAVRGAARDRADGVAADGGKRFAAMSVDATS